MNQRTHLRIHGLDGRSAQYPPKKLNRMTSHVHGNAASTSLNIPEMIGVGSAMFFALLDQRRSPQGTTVKQLLKTNILGSKAEFFGVHQFHAGRSTGVNHLVRFGQVQTEWFFADHVLARCRRGHRHFAVQVIRCTNDDHVQFGQRQQLLVVGKVIGNVPIAIS